MTTLRLTTFINAPIERCFDLSRSIDLHVLSTEATKEKAIAGKTSGLINKAETVTWEAVHFGIKQKLTVKIVEMESPFYFSDEMVEGAFKKMYHEHQFETSKTGTLVTDVFSYETPYGAIGRLFDALILKHYMLRFLAKRNETIKRIAEGNAWQDILSIGQ